MARMLMETINNMLIELYAAMAQAEIEKKEKRQCEGIDSKKAHGEWDDYGRPAVMPIDEFSEHYQKVVSGEIRPFELMKQLGIKSLNIKIILQMFWLMRLTAMTKRKHQFSSCRWNIILEVAKK